MIVCIIFVTYEYKILDIRYLIIYKINYNLYIFGLVKFLQRKVRFGIFTLQDLCH